MSDSNTTQPKPLADLDKRQPNQLYRRAILSSLDDLKDMHSRSNVELIRGRTQTLLEDTGHQFDIVVFARTMKSVASKGEINLDAHALAQLSPKYKRKRIDIISRKMSSDPEVEAAPSLPLLMQASSPMASHHYSSHTSPTNDRSVEFKVVPVRKPDRDKWKITPRKIVDKTHIVNPMDTH